MIGQFEHFFVTNSYPTAQKLSGIEPFEILSIAPDLITHLLADPTA